MDQENRIKLFEPGRAGAWFALLMLLCAAYAGRHWLISDGFIDAARDESLYLPAILRNSNPALYPRDYFLGHFQLATGLFLDLSSWLLRLAGGDYRFLFLSVSTTLLFIFISGIFVLVRSITGSPAASFLAGLVLMRPREAMGGVGFAVYVGNYQPRIFIDALTPWFFWALLRSDSVLHYVLLGFSLGFASWLYPVYPLQLAILFILLAFFMKRYRGAAALAIAFSGIFIPYHLRSALAAAGPLIGNASQAALYRWEGMIYPRAGGIVVQFMRNFSLPLGLGLAGLAALRGSIAANPKLRLLLAAVPMAAALIAAAYLSYISPATIPLLLLRVGRLYHMIFLVIGAAGAAALFSRGGKPLLKSAYLGLVLANILVTAPLSLSRGSGPAADYGPATREKKDFLAAAAAVKRLTPLDSIFLIPTEQLNNFPVYSERGIVVSYKTAPWGSDPALLARWYEAYGKVRAAYESGDFSRIKEAAREYGADYILLYRGTAKTREIPVIRYGNFEIYRAGPLPGATVSGKGAI